MHILSLYGISCLVVALFLSPHSELCYAFRVDVNQTAGVVFEDDPTTTAAPDSLTVTTEVSTAEVATQNVMPISFDAEGITVSNHTKMIVANEISNLPRFDPKNNKNKNNKNAQDWLPPTAVPPVLDSVLESDEVTNLRNVSNPNTNIYEDSCQFCPEARFMQHYFAKNCIAMQLQEDCKPKFCPKYFDCPKEKKLPKDGCLYHEKVYKFGDNVPHRDPCQHCVCINSTNGPMLTCAISECVNAWTALQPNCYRKYTEGKCCPEIVCAPKNKTLATCSLEGKVHNFGDYFSPEDDPCHNCLCDERWAQNENPLESASCTRIECHIDYERAENKGCVPVYSDKSCCPMYFHCPPESSNANQPKCKFGGNTYEIGEKVRVKQHEICLECSCLVPPEISCKHKSCPPMPNNCTSMYIEGECCPQFKCDHEKVDSFHEETSIKDDTVEKMGPTEEVQCPPVEACTPPCKLSFDEMDDANLSDQSERVKCAKCDCLQQTSVNTLQAIQTESANSTSSTNIPCDKQPCTPSKQPDSEPNGGGDAGRWAKSARVHQVKSSPKATKRCPDIACEYPCYIYRVSAADCPRCSCPSKPDKATPSKVHKFVASSLLIQNGSLIAH